MPPRFSKIQENWPKLCHTARKLFTVVYSFLCDLSFFSDNSWSNGHNAPQQKVSWHISDTNNNSFKALAIYGVSYPC